MERSEQAWLERQRAERETEFAPPSFYYEDKKPNTQTLSKMESSKKERDSEFAPPAFYHKDGTPGTHTNSDRQSDASNLPLQANDTQSDILDDKTNVVDKSSEILANVIMNKLRGYRHQSGGEAGYTPTGDGGAEQCNAPAHMDMFVSPLNSTVSSSTPQVNSMQAGQYGHDSAGIQNVPYPVQDTSVPPPNFQVPPANYQAPFPCTNMPPPTYNVPPPSAFPNTNIPPPNLSVPPPNINIPNYPLPNIHQPPPPPPPPQAYPANTEHFTSTDFSYQGQSSAPYSGETNQVAQCQSEAIVAQPKKVIPKMDIMDTRLVQNEDN